MNTQGALCEHFCSVLLQRGAFPAGCCHMVAATTSSEKACWPIVKRALLIPPHPFCYLSCLAGTKQVVMLDGCEQPLSQVRGSCSFKD